MITDVVPELLAPAAMEPTLLPPSRASPGSRALSADKQKLVVDAPADPAPLFCVVSVTIMLAPAPVVEGGVTADTTRSGPIFIEVLYFVLLSSFVSAS